MERGDNGNNDGAGWRRGSWEEGIGSKEARASGFLDDGSKEAQE